MRLWGLELSTFRKLTTLCSQLIDNQDEILTFDSHYRFWIDFLVDKTVIRKTNLLTLQSWE